MQIVNLIVHYDPERLFPGGGMTVVHMFDDIFHWDANKCTTCAALILGETQDGIAIANNGRYVFAAMPLETAEHYAHLIHNYGKWGFHVSIERFDGTCIANFNIGPCAHRMASNGYKSRFLYCPKTCNGPITHTEKSDVKGAIRAYYCKAHGEWMIARGTSTIQSIDSANLKPLS